MDKIMLKRRQLEPQPSSNQSKTKWERKTSRADDNLHRITIRNKFGENDFFWKESIFAFLSTGISLEENQLHLFWNVFGTRLSGRPRSACRSWRGSWARRWWPAPRPSSPARPSRSCWRDSNARTSDSSCCFGRWDREAAAVQARRVQGASAEAQEPERLRSIVNVWPSQQMDTWGWWRSNWVWIFRARHKKQGLVFRLA